MKIVKREDKLTEISTKPTRVWLILTRPINRVDSKFQLTLQREIVDFLKTNLHKNVKVCILYVGDVLYESEIEGKVGIKDWIFIHPRVLGDNLGYFHKFHRVITILRNKTVYSQPICYINPVNEIVSYNTGFYVMYINEFDDDTTGEQFAILGDEDDFIMSMEHFNKLIEINQCKTS